MGLGGRDRGGGGRLGGRGSFARPYWSHHLESALRSTKCYSKPRSKSATGTLHDELPHTDQNMRTPAPCRRQKRARPQSPLHTKRLSCFFWVRGSSRWSGFTCTGCAADAGSRSGTSSMAVVVEGVAMMTDMGEYSALWLCAFAGFVHLLARWTASGKDCGAPWRCHCAGVQHFIRTLCSLPVERSSARTALTARCLSMGVCPSNPAETTRTRISRPSARRARPSRTPSTACPSVTSVTARWWTGASAARSALPIASPSSCIAARSETSFSPGCVGCCRSDWCPPGVLGR